MHGVEHTIAVAQKDFPVHHQGAGAITRPGGVERSQAPAGSRVQRVQLAIQSADVGHAGTDTERSPERFKEFWQTRDASFEDPALYQRLD
ncbi:MAG: hypothetical protein JXQ71_18120 [Verrucomicrobia bacterium]|nr:hypothetical protein [Verrucomicrobiota bacterium]